MASVSRYSRDVPDPEPVTSTTPGRGVPVVFAGARTVPCRVSPPNPAKLTSVEVRPDGAGIEPDADAGAGGRPTRPRRTTSAATNLRPGILKTSVAVMPKNRIVQRNL